MKKRYLVLADGTVFEGQAFGAEGDVIGEVVFTTGVCGYIETLTDPSYYGQIVMQTFPMIGNYGIIEEDFEGECHVRGYVVREWCDAPSNFRCQYDADAFLKKKGVPGLCGVDTRAITKVIREHGVMNGIICDELPADLSAVKAYRVEKAVEAVTCPEPVVYPALADEKYRVTLIDYGTKKNIITLLRKAGCTVRRVPAFTPAEEILAGHPDGVMLSNGPGDPADNGFCIEQIRKLMGQVPIFGICLGHQMTALAAGGRTMKLKYGHHGSNQPVCHVSDKRHYITCQNHNYAVVGDSIKNGVVSFVNANDQTCEGVDYPALKAFTVQFHPEARSGPHDTEKLFDRFIAMMEENGYAAE